MKVTVNKYAAATYDLSVGEGEERELMEEATAEAPLRLVYGTGMILPTFEKALNGLEVGGMLNFPIEPAEAYGEYNEEHILDLLKNILEVDGKLDVEMIKKGNTIPMMGSSDNRVNDSVLEVKDDTVIMGFNHSLADKTLCFSDEVTDTHEPIAGEITAFSTPAGGCNCGCDDRGNDCGDNYESSYGYSGCHQIMGS